MMRAMAAWVGAVPLMGSHGSGSERRQPLGFTMFGGLLVSQALTLFTTPVIYLYLDRLSHWLSGGPGKAHPPSAAPKREPAWSHEQVKAAERPEIPLTPSPRPSTRTGRMSRPSTPVP